MFFDSTLKKGLSLMEVMIVLAIMAVFATLVGPRVFSYLGRAKIKTTEANLRTIKQAITSYHIDTGRYPETLQDLMRKPFDEAAARKWQGPYLEGKDDEVPEDGWSHEFVYRRNEPGSAKPYDLYSYGPDGEDSSEENWIYA